MGRILAIDYGQKRAGVAATDEMQLIANGLNTVHIKDIWIFLDEYMKKEKVDCIVVGEPKDMMNRPSDSTKYIEPFVKKLAQKYPQILIKRFDERFTSKMAHDTMIASGIRKSKRQDKSLVDTISATIILQSYMNSINQ
ncbi:MAG: Holliday junction resolvase RuvX [Bacteroidetes bacterium]|nr:Holliday junction resolvase RuvX [Bacteroidota bacterium]MBL6944074.1 Holliday junction resolvase RuvX [Bacteroidales bacterium]